MTAYDGAVDHLRDELRRLDLLLVRYLEAWRADRGGAGEGGGLYVSDAQVDRLLGAEPLVDAGGHGAATTTGGRSAGPAGEPPGSSGVAGEAGVDDKLRAHAREVRERERESREAGVRLPLAALADRFGLGRRHVDVLLVALAPELDLKYETIYAYLQDDLTRKRPTAGLTLRVVGGTVGSEADQRTLLTPGSPLVEHRLLEFAGEERPLLSRPVTVDRRVVAALLGEDDLDGRLRDVAEVVSPAAALPPVTAPDACGDAGPLARLPVPAATRERLRALRDRVAGDPPAMVHLEGPYGAGGRAAAAALAAAVDRPLVAADADRVPADAAGETLARLRREARLRGGAIHVRNLPPPDHQREETGGVGLSTILEQLDEFEGPVFLSGSASVPPRLAASCDGHAFVTVTFDRPSFDLRRSLWEQTDLPGDADELASKFSFTAGQIADAASTARSLAPGDPTAEDVFEACRAQSRDRLNDLARQLEPTYGWEDIVLPAAELRELREVAAHVEHHGTVYGEWGFETQFSLGTGVNVLFAGPSGTGKTMAAEVLAGDAGLDLYKVDLASVVSKYIGETESNLGRVFDQAESSNALLFFDEADALFGERSEVSDAHDRYANVEVDYLLERMEEHDGVVLLATNLEENIDDAFRRRINLTVEFPLPDRDARERIWRSVFPDDTPVGDLDWPFLATFNLTGGDIKNAALTAAFLAAAEGDTVEMRHAVHALWRELEKGGRLLSRDDFGEYREHLP